MLNRTKVIILMLLIILVVLYVWDYDIGYKNPVLVSTSIQESKKRQVFVKEYQIELTEVLDTTYCFPFTQAWEEQSWHLTQSKWGREIPVVDTTSIHKIVFSRVAKDTFFHENAIGTRWIMWGCSEQLLGGGQINGMVTVYAPLISPDTIPLIIYKQSIQYNMKEGLIPIFRFKLIAPAPQRSGVPRR